MTSSVIAAIDTTRKLRTTMAPEPEQLGHDKQLTVTSHQGTQVRSTTGIPHARFHIRR